MPTDAATTTLPGCVCAIGDIHGCLDKLEALLARLDADIGLDSCRLVFIGDYIDRGPDSAGVIDRLIELGKTKPDTVYLRGNHEIMFLDFLADPARGAPMFLENGGRETLRSYGCRVGWPRGVRALGEDALRRLPQAHRAFLDETVLRLRLGDYFFCHAGVRPGVSLDDQDPEDLVWIRGEFLDSSADFGAIVVHGHTPSSDPIVRRNRIGVDTGAVYGGALTAVVLDGTQTRFVQV